MFHLLETMASCSTVPQRYNQRPLIQRRKKTFEIKEYSAPSVSITYILSAFLINACNFSIKQPVSKLLQIVT